MLHCRPWISIVALVAAACAVGCGDKSRNAKSPQGATAASAQPAAPPWKVAFDFRHRRAPAKSVQPPPSVLEAEARIPACGGAPPASPVVDDSIDGDFLGTGKPVQAVLVNRRRMVGAPDAAGMEEIKSVLVVHDAGNVVLATRVPDTLSFGGTFSLARSKGSKDGIVMLRGIKSAGQCRESASLVEVSDNRPIEIRTVDYVTNCNTSPEGCSRPKGRMIEFRMNRDAPEFLETPIPWGPGDPCPASSAAASGGPPPAHS